MGGYLVGERDQPEVCHLFRKPGSPNHQFTRVETDRRQRSRTIEVMADIRFQCARVIYQTETKGNSMKPIMRYQGQLLFRTSYKPARRSRIRIRSLPAPKLEYVFRPRGAGLKPEIQIVL